MPIHNTEVEQVLTQIADLLEIKGANPFRVRSYRAAAQTVGTLGREVSDMLADGEDLSELPGIGKDLAGKIKDVVETGTLEMLEELKRELPEAILALLDVEGLGPKRVKTLFDKLGVRSLGELKAAAQEQKVRDLPGFGVRTEERILKSVDQVSSRRAQGRTLLGRAEGLVEPLLDYLRRGDGVTEVMAAGSYRRRKETVGDADILVTVEEGSPIMDHFVGYDEVRRVLSKGGTRTSVVLRSGLQVDVRVVPAESRGAALVYFTGSKAHNISIRRLGVARGLKINEYGVFKGEERVGGSTEEEVYGHVDLPWIEPELREDRGELEAARKGELPKLVTLDDIKGDVHVHTNWTDGRNTSREMVEAAMERGYEYVGITDHTRRLTVTGGLGPAELRRQLEELRRLDDEISGITVLRGSEVDIMEDGTLDLPDDVLAELDYAICSVHYKFGLSREAQTERVLRAMDNRHFSIMAHPTGRMLLQREPYEIDLERVMEAAAERGVIMEVNAFPDRLDLDDVYSKMARDMGVLLSIDTDAHATEHLAHMKYGVGQARRGWLEAAHVVNTRSLPDLRKLLRR